MSALLIEISPVSVDVGITFLTFTFMLTPSQLSHFQPNLKPIAMNRVRKRLFKNPTACNIQNFNTSYRRYSTFIFVQP